MVAIRSRGQWGAGGSTAGRGVALSSRRWFVAHYPGTATAGSGDQAVRNIDAYHRNTQRWAIIGYNYLIDRNGVIYEGAGLNIRGIHSPPRNTDGFGVCFLVGNNEQMSAAMRNSGRALYDWLNRQAGRTLGRAGHRTHFATACPGNNVMAWINGGLAAPGGGGTVTPPPQPPTGTAPAFPSSCAPWFGQRARNRCPGVRTWQQRMAQRGWRIGVDGIYGPQSENVCRLFQAEKRLGVDGLVGPITWRAAWTAPVT